MTSALIFPNPALSSFSGKSIVCFAFAEKKLRTRSPRY